MENKNLEKGFTLIELLVVLAIVAILSVVVVLTLNPAELLKQARDSNRISDMATLKSAISLYLADVSSPSMGSATTCYETVTSTNQQCGVFSSNISAASSSASKSVNGTGWIPINFASISSGAPIGNLPIDPVNSASFYYVYQASSSYAFLLGTPMESVKYGTTTATKVVGNGTSGVGTSTYLVGTAPGLVL